MDTGRNKIVPKTGSNSAGRITVDNRGRNIWQWNDSQLDSTSILLKKLENTALELEPTRKVRRPDPDPTELASTPKATSTSASARKREGRSAADARERKGTATLAIEQTFKVKLGGGFDPYNRS